MSNGSTGDYRAKTMPVESFLVANAFGLYELHGNIWEICADTWHDNYSGAPTDGSAWIDDRNDERRVVRGGSWYYYPNKCRSAFRNYIQPHLHNGLGFRVVCGVVRNP
ncbi:hypothetical protein B7486_49910 [cyanobacterium TDX16]|nr:hypothetical protein B7486_49910 [cyanobacterium TDX16]